MRTALFVIMLMLLFSTNSYAECPIKKIGFSGSVASGQTYSQTITSSLIFYLDPSDNENGWTMKISGPRAQKVDSYDEYYIDFIYPATPPYRMNPTQYLDGSYGRTVENGDIREFYFLLNYNDLDTADMALQKVNWPKNERDQEEGLSIIDMLTKAKGTLTVTSIKYTQSGDIKKYTDMAFTVNISLPANTNCQ